MWLFVLKGLHFIVKRMSQTKKTYTLGKIKQLIDLNGDSTNFDLSFKVTCKDDTPFDLLVVDQTTLDNTPELQYKKVNNTISGNIVSDKNIYQNFFLILKSDKKCDVNVELTKKVLPKTPNVGTEINTEINTSSIPATNGIIDPNYPNHRQLPEDSINWKKIGLIALVVIIGICVLVWLYKRKDSNPTEISPTEISPTENFPTENFPTGYFNDVSLNNPKLSTYSHKSPSLSQTSRHSFVSSYKSSGSDRSNGSSGNGSDRSSGSSGSGSDNGNSLISRLKKFSQ